MPPARGTEHATRAGCRPGQTSGAAGGGSGRLPADPGRRPARSESGACELSSRAVPVNPSLSGTWAPGGAASGADTQPALHSCAQRGESARKRAERTCGACRPCHAARREYGALSFTRRSLGRGGPVWGAERKCVTCPRRSPVAAAAADNRSVYGAAEKAARWRTPGRSETGSAGGDKDAWDWQHYKESVT